MQVVPHSTPAAHTAAGVSATTIQLLILLVIALSVFVGASLRR